MNSMPFPSNDDVQPIHLKPNHKGLPWKKFHASESSLMCFEIRFRNGCIETFPYSDFRGTRLIHAGHLTVNIYGMEKYQITVLGRNLGELARHLSLGRIDWFGENEHGQRCLETASHIETITIETLEA